MVAAKVRRYVGVCGAAVISHTRADPSCLQGARSLVLVLEHHLQTWSILYSCSSISSS